MPAMLYDAADAAECVLHEAGDDTPNEGVCMPDSYDATAVYADATCTQPVALVPPGFPIVDVAYPPPPPACDGDVDRFVQAAAPTTSMVIYTVMAGTCEQVAFPVGDVAYSTGSAVDLPLLALGPDTSTARIRSIDYSADGVALADPDTLYDTALDTRCEMQVADDGAERCLPIGVSSATAAFADAACVQPLALVQSGATPPCAPPAPPRYAIAETSTACGPQIAVLAVGAAYSGAVYELTGGACTPIAAPTGYTFYAVGEEVPAATFASATDVIE
jgi:hypothetical protein